MHAAFFGQFVKLGFAARLCLLPVGGEELLILQAMEGRIERALLYLQRFARHLLDSVRDGVAVDRAKSDDAEDEEVESALREVESVFCLHAYGFYIYPFTCRRSRYVDVWRASEDGEGRRIFHRWLIRRNRSLSLC